MMKLLKLVQVYIIDEFAADLDILSRSHFLNYLSQEYEERCVSVVYATHIFDQVDSWVSHISFIQLDIVLSPIHDLESLPPYKKFLAQLCTNCAMCPMYMLAMEELERRHRGSVLFVENYDTVSGQKLVNAVMSE